METSLPSPMNGRVELLIYWRVMALNSYIMGGGYIAVIVLHIIYCIYIYTCIELFPDTLDFSI